MKVLLKRFSKLQDQDYLDKQEDRKRVVKDAPKIHAIGLGVAGGLSGAGIGGTLASKSGNKGALIGAGIGTIAGGVGGYFTGKRTKRIVEEDANRKIKRYKKADEKDKRYLREKEEKERDRDIQRRQAFAQERIAWHTL